MGLCGNVSVSFVFAEQPSFLAFDVVILASVVTKGLKVLFFVHMKAQGLM